MRSKSSSGGLVQRREHFDPCVVDDDVQAAEVGCRRDHAADVFGRPHVARDAEHVASQLRAELLGTRHVADRDPATGLHVCLGDRASDAASSARDEGALAYELSGHLSST